ncbi:hypothetical protein Tco_1262333 [Tanacetum coccineum]
MRCKINQDVFEFIISGGSSENMISLDIVTRLKLTPKKHPKPYKIGWIEAVGDVKKTCNNDKNLSEIQLEHEKEDEFMVVVVKVVHECRHWIDYYVNQEWWKCCGVGYSFDLLRDCKMVLKEIVSRLLEEEEVSHFGKEVMILEWMFCVSILV